MAGRCEIHDATITPTKLELVQGWLPRQRWYVGKDHAPRLERVGSYRFEDPAGSVGIETLLVRDVAATVPVLYQVPVTYRAEPLEGAEAALIGRCEHSVLGTRYVYDAPHDPVYVRELVRTICEADTEATPSRGPHDVHVVGEPAEGTDVLRMTGSSVLTGEQSNTSIVVQADRDGRPGPVVVKIFRVLHDGDNPDVVVQRALAQAGSELVPEPVGDLHGTWTHGGHGHLAFAQEFLPDVRDAWQVALSALKAGDDFTERARALGEATGQVHRDLAQALGTTQADEADRDALLASMRSRLALAIEARPSLRRQEERIVELLGAARDVDWPRLQRIHGDYHLGQVLQAPRRGWVLLDFEGEPLRPLDERCLPDLPERDIAGMLRSFDYAAGQHLLNHPDADPQPALDWARAAREAFLDGYADAAGTDPRVTSAQLLTALELDKALYEITYEVRNRPSWLPIPAAAVHRLLREAGRRVSRGHVGDGSNDTTSSVHTDAPEGPTVTGQTRPTSLSEPTGATSAPPAPPAPPTPPAPPAPTSATTGASPARAGEPPRATGPSGASPAGARSPEPILPPPAFRPVAVARADLERIVGGTHHDPHSVLGPHPSESTVTVRVLAPGANRVRLHLGGGRTAPMEHEDRGLFVVVLPGTQVPDYRVGVDYGDGFEHVCDDPYRFLPTIGEVDVHLISEGRHERLWEVLGSHLRSYPGPLGDTSGASFAVWAPNAVAVRVAGDFNTWTSARHPMRSMGGSGLWELFIPGVTAGARYKYEILTKDGRWIAKADPMARATEVPPATASVVTESSYQWGDEQWLAERGRQPAHESPVSVYEVHLGSWRQGLSYTELADQLVAYVKDTGFTHVELLPVAEHPYGPSWGYQVTGYYAPTSRFGSPDEFRHLVDSLHQAGIGVILDWVPAHFPKDAFALAAFDGEALYEHPDPRRGDQPDWGTHVFDFGRPQVRNFLVANALYWIDQFHVDGLRVDAVASMLYLDYSRRDGEWLPNQFGGREHLEAVQFLQETNATVYKHHPGVLMIAEESTSWPGVTRPTHLGGLGFGFKWNMGWMHDSLEYVEHEPIHRQYHHHQMTFGMVYAYSENFVLPISHDEVVYGKGSLLRKMPGDRWQQLANVRAYLAFMWSFPGKQLLFMGQEFAQEAEWADAKSLDWWLLDQPAHLGVHQMVKAMNAAYRSQPALWQLDCDPAGFSWIDANDAGGNTFSFVRYGTAGADGSAPATAVVSNFSGGPHHQYRIGLPRPGTWTEVLNTDATEWGGSGVGNLGAVVAEEIPWHGMPYSAEITVPPLATVWFAPEGGSVCREELVVRQERPELVAAAEAQAVAEAEAAGDAARRPELEATSEPTA